MAVDVEQIDPRNEPALRAWWEVGRAATADRPGRPWPAWEQSRVALTSENPERGVSLLAAIDGREMVGAALVVRPLKDNLHSAAVDVHVHPGRRREGIGSALLVDAETIVAGDGRSTVQGEGYLPPAGTAPAEPFARARGYDVVHRESVQELRVADYLDRREAVRATVAAAASYRVVTFDTVCPEEHVGSFGRRCLTALAVAPDGSVVGASDVRVDDADESHGQVGITLVDPAHRGHRLGLALKLATHDLALATYPGLVSLDTSNAEVDSHMNAVDEALGYRTIGTLLELQKRL